MHLRDVPGALFGSSPYEGFDAESHEVDLQGWGSTSKLFASVFDALSPEQVIEVGSWKGASAVHMAGLMKERGLDGVILCVDTWLGSGEHWMVKEFRGRMNLANGRPRLYEQFLANVVKSEATERVFPLPMSSFGAAQLLTEMSVTADLVYVDGGHAEEEVSLDLASFWRLLRPGGMMIADDYEPRWPGVVRAVNRFAADRTIALMTGDNKAVLRKP